MNPGVTVVRPPFQAGMVPSLLAAFSAPIGVRAALRAAASSAETAAWAAAYARVSAIDKAARPLSLWLRFMVITGSKGVREGSRHKVAILEGLGPGIGAVLIRVVERVRWPEIVGVGHRETPRVAVDGIDPNGKITATCGNPSIRVAHSQRPRSLGGKSQADRQAQVDTINHTAIHRLQYHPESHAIPGAIGVECRRVSGHRQEAVPRDFANQVRFTPQRPRPEAANRVDIEMRGPADRISRIVGVVGGPTRCKGAHISRLTARQVGVVPDRPLDGHIEITERLACAGPQGGRTLVIDQ